MRLKAICILTIIISLILIIYFYYWTYLYLLLVKYVSELVNNIFIQAILILIAIAGALYSIINKLKKNPGEHISKPKGYSTSAIKDPHFNSDDFFNNPPIYPQPPVTLSALYRLEKLLNCKLTSQLNFANIAIDEDKCTWFLDTDLLERYKFDAKVRNGIIISKSFGDSFVPELKEFYHCANWHFQQGNARKNPGKVNDPVLDVTIKNDGNKTILVTSIGVIPLALWAIPKRIPQPSVVSIFDSYNLKINFEMLICALNLSDPIEVPPNAPLRFLLRFIDYSYELNRFLCNESLIALIINYEQDSAAISKPIFLGILN